MTKKETQTLDNIPDTKIRAAKPTNDINEHDTILPHSFEDPKKDENAGKIGSIPAVDRKLHQEEAAKKAEKPRFIDDVKAFLDPAKHPGPPDEAYNTRHPRDDVNAPNGGAKGVAPDAAYQTN